MNDTEKLERVRIYCHELLNSFDQKPSSKEDPYMYGFLTGIEHASEWILEEILEEKL